MSTCNDDWSRSLGLSQHDRVVEQGRLRSAVLSLRHRSVPGRQRVLHLELFTTASLSQKVKCKRLRYLFLRKIIILIIPQNLHTNKNTKMD